MRKTPSENEIVAWIEKGRFYFRSFQPQDENFNKDEIQRGLKILKQVLRPEEGFPKEFIEWLFEKDILHKTLFNQKLV